MHFQAPIISGHVIGLSANRTASWPNAVSVAAATSSVVIPCARATGSRLRKTLANMALPVPSGSMRPVTSVPSGAPAPACSKSRVSRVPTLMSAPAAPNVPKMTRPTSAKLSSSGRMLAVHAGGFAVHPWADTMQPEPAEHTGHMAPAGDLWSTADDLCRFAAFLLNGDDRVLPLATLEEMRAPAAPPSGGGYGLGIQVAERAERTLFGHGGSMPGFLVTLWVSPDDGLGAVTLANATAGPAIGEIAADLIDIVASREPCLPERWKPQTDIGADLLALTGLWSWGPRATMLRVLSRDMIELAPVAGPGRASRFRAAADGTWTGLDGYYASETLRVVPADDDVAAHLDLGTFIFTREPYGPGSPVAARPSEDGWQAG